MAAVTLWFAAIESDKCFWNEPRIYIYTRLISKIRADGVEIKNQLTEKYVSVVSNLYITTSFYKVVTIIL